MQGIGQNTTQIPLIESRPYASVSEGQALRRQSRFRLAVGWLTLVMWGVAAFGLDWDAEWHLLVGRDGFWTPPHLVFYSTIAAAGLICIGVVLLETWLYYRRYPGYNDATTTPILWLFRGPVGFALAGFGMVVMLSSAPLDDYWHRIYGIDLKVWTPFHVMLMIGVIMANLGLIYVFASEVNRQPKTTNAGWLGEIRSLFHPATLGLVGAMTFFISRFLFLMGPDTGLESGSLRLGGLVLPSYSLIVAMLPAALVALAGLGRRFGIATLVGLFLLLFKLIDMPIIQAGIDYLVKDQGRSLRANTTGTVVWVWIYPIALPLAGLAIDLVLYGARRWPNRKLLAAAVAGLAGGLVLFLTSQPWEQINEYLRSFYTTPAARTQLENRLFHPDYWAALPLALVIAALAGLVGWAWSLSLRYTER